MVNVKTIEKILLLFTVGLWIFFTAGTAFAKSPNIVLILADDLGFTDTAPYGSEIPTPNISSLADEGLVFTNYHTAALCSPTRAMLMTGVDSHRNGVPNIPEALPPDQAEHEHYKETLNHKVVTSPPCSGMPGTHLPDRQMAPGQDTGSAAQPERI